MRHSSILLALAAAITFTACADVASPTAPTPTKVAPDKPRHDGECLSGYIDAMGIFVCTDSL